MSRSGAYPMSGGMGYSARVFFFSSGTNQDQSQRGGEEEEISYDGDASENIARVNAASTLHFDDANRGVAFAI